METESWPREEAAALDEASPPGPAGDFFVDLARAELALNRPEPARLTRRR